MRKPLIRKLLMGSAVLSLLVAGPVAQVARAQDSASKEESERGRASQARMEREVRESEKREKEDGAVARRRLKTEFHIDASKMSDTDAIARLHDEVQDRDAAREAAEQKRRDDAEARQEKQRQELVDKQNARLKQTFGKTSDEISDDEDAAQLQMYETMVQQGVAPQCRGKKDKALVDCVDKALGAQ